MGALTPGREAGTEVRVLRGQIWVYRAFDIAGEIDLREVERILMQPAEADAVARPRLSITRAPRHAIMVRNLPVRIRIGMIEVEGIAQPVETFVTVFDYGVVSFCFQVSMPAGCPWSEWVRKADDLGPDTELGLRLESIARNRATELIKILKPALKTPYEREIFEDYVIHFLEKVEGIENGMDLLIKADVPALILAESKEPLSPGTRQAILDSAHQYGVADLTVLDWNSALLLEPSGVRDTADVIEFALTHLLEFRYYDLVLDDRLQELYDAIERRRARAFPLRMVLKEDFADLSREANSRYLEFSEFIERIDNSLKVVGDSYLAVVFRATVRRFRLQDWKESVGRKLQLLAQVSELLQGEVDVYRGHTLELIVIALIAFEIFSAIVRKL